MKNQKSKKQNQSNEPEKVEIEDILYSEKKRRAVLQKPYYQDAEGTKDRIKDAYMRYNLSRQNVIEFTGAPISVVDEWLYGPIDRATGKRTNTGWFSEREDVKNNLIKMVTKAKKESLENIWEYGTLIVSTKLKALASKGEEVSISDADKVMSIMERADHIMKVDDEKPTDIKKQVRLNADQLKAKFDDLAKADPYGPYAKGKKIVQADPPKLKDIEDEETH